MPPPKTRFPRQADIRARVLHQAEDIYSPDHLQQGTEIDNKEDRTGDVTNAARSLRGTPIDLVLLDMNLPDGHGLELARRIRSAEIPVDIIAITAVRETDVVRTAIRAGAGLIGAGGGGPRSLAGNVSSLSRIPRR